MGSGASQRAAWGAMLMVRFWWVVGGGGGGVGLEGGGWVEGSEVLLDDAWFADEDVDVLAGLKIFVLPCVVRVNLVPRSSLMSRSMQSPATSPPPYVSINSSGTDDGCGAGVGGGPVESERSEWGALSLLTPLTSFEALSLIVCGGSI